LWDESVSIGNLYAPLLHIPYTFSEVIDYKPVNQLSDNGQ
jgi:hypothetical protein